MKKIFSFLAAMLFAFGMTAAEFTEPAGSYYLKHNWGGAGDWTWKQTAYDAESGMYILRDIYGGTGCNYNTSASDNGSQWVANPTLVGNPAPGDSAVFSLNGETKAITITRIGEPAPAPTTYFLKHDWGGAGNWTWKEMTREGETSIYNLRDIYGGTGCNYNSYAADGGSTWVANPTLVGNPATGDSAVFTFDGETSTITITRIGGSAPEPVITYFLGASFNDWTAAASPFEGNTITVNVTPGTHEFKVVKLVNGGAETWLGYDEILDPECSQEGVSKNAEWGNIMVTLAGPGTITVTIGENGMACVTFTQQEAVKKNLTLHAGDLMTDNPTLFLLTSLDENATDGAPATETIKLTPDENGDCTVQVFEDTKRVYLVRCAPSTETIDWSNNVWNGTSWIDFAPEFWFSGFNEWFIVLTTTIPSATDLVSAKEATAVKVVREGHLYILREGVIYNLNGAVVR